MEENTAQIVKSETTTSDTTGDAELVSNHESKVLNVSIRGWIAFLVVTTVCAMGLTQLEVKEPLYTLSVAIVSFYYGQNLKKV